MLSSSGRVHDRELLDALDSLDAAPFTGMVWRVAWASRSPLTGSVAGGRWHPENSFGALYTSLEADGALAEIYFHLSRAPVFASRPMRLHEIAVETRRTLQISDLAILERLGVDMARYRSLDHVHTREIGAAAYLLDCDSLLVPSARWNCLNLVLFLDRLAPDAALTVRDGRDVNWPAWREQQVGSTRLASE